MFVVVGRPISSALRDFDRQMRHGLITTPTTSAHQPSTMAAQRVIIIKARIAQIRTRTAQVEAEIERGQTERDQLRVVLAEAEAELKEAVDAPVENGVDPTGWLPNEVLLIIFSHLNCTVLGRCARVCGRWHGLCGLKSERAAIASRWWTFNNGRSISTEWTGHTDGIQALVIHDDILYSASQDCTIRVWSMDDSKCLQTLTGHTNLVNGLAAGSDRTLYSASGDRTVRVWSIVDGSNLETLTGHTAPVRCVTAARTRLVFSGSEDMTIKVWRRGGTQTTCIRTLVGHTDHVFSLALSADHNTLYSGSGDTTIRVWSVSDGVCRKILTGHTNEVYAIVVGVGGTLYSGGRDKTIRVWRGSDGKLLSTLDHHKDAVLSLALGPDDTVLSGFGFLDRSVAMWCGRTLTRIATLSRLPNYVDALAVGPDGTVFVGSRESGTIFVFPHAGND